MVRVNEVLVGSWIRRTPSRPWHKAQSIFIDEVLTKCGKFMSRWNKKGQELEAHTSVEAGVTVQPDDLCRGCFPNAEAPR